jgi:Cytochrome P450
VAPFYRKEVIQRYDPLLDSCIADLQMILNEEKEKRRKVDLAELINLFAFDAIGRITVSGWYQVTHKFWPSQTSNSFGGLRGDMVPKKFLFALKVALRYLSTIGDFSEWHPCLFSVTQYLGPLNGLPVVNNFVQEQINVRLGLGSLKSSQNDMIADFTPFAMSQENLSESRLNLRHLCETNILPGGDSTSTAICACLFYLSRYPNANAKLRDELCEYESRAIEEKTPALLGALPYLQAVVKESMRLHPPIGLMNPRVVPAGGATISQHYFASGVGSNLPSQE